MHVGQRHVVEPGAGHHPCRAGIDDVARSQQRQQRDKDRVLHEVLGDPHRAAGVKADAHPDLVVVTEDVGPVARRCHERLVDQLDDALRRAPAADVLAGARPPRRDLEGVDRIVHQASSAAAVGLAHHHVGPGAGHGPHGQAGRQRGAARRRPLLVDEGHELLLGRGIGGVGGAGVRHVAGRKQGNDDDDPGKPLHWELPHGGG